MTIVDVLLCQQKFLSPHSVSFMLKERLVIFLIVLILVLKSCEVCFFNKTDEFEMFVRKLMNKSYKSSLTDDAVIYF